MLSKEEGGEMMKTEFIGWEKSLLELVTERLLRESQGDTLDFSRMCIIAPTANSCRKLRSELILRLTGFAYFPPKLVTPDFFLHSGGKKDIANIFQTTSAWIETLSEAPIDILESLYLRKNESFERLLGVSNSIKNLRMLLAENGLTIGELARNGSKSGLQEPERWNALAKLEDIYIKNLHDAGFHDAEFSKIKFDPASLLENIDRLLIVGVCDPIPLVMKKLEALKTIELEVWIHAPANFADRFDAWGRPILGKWENSHIDFKGNEENIRLAGSADSQVELILDIIFDRIKPVNSNDFALASLNPSLLPILSKSFADMGIKTYNPAGENLTLSSIYHLLDNFCRLVETESYEAFSLIARHPHLLDYASNKIPFFSRIEFLSALDRAQNEYLPVKISGLERAKNAQIKSFIQIIEGFLADFNKMTLHEFLSKILEEVYLNKNLSFSIGSDISLMDSAKCISLQISCLGDSKLEQSSLSRSKKLKLFLSILKDTKYYSGSLSNSIPLHGWLELQWENAENLVICGANEGFLPESIVGDIFIPEIPREKLGLRNNKRRFARDAYILSALIESRKASVHLIAGKRDVSEEPLKASRLLFMCDDSKMLLRAKKLFGNPEDKEVRPLTRSIQWKLKVPINETVKKLSVTSFKKYLLCPFRFYLSEILRMREIDDGKKEFDAMDFGNLIHNVLQSFALNKSAKDFSDEGKILDFLNSDLDKIIKKRYSTQQHLSLTIQIESMKNRLAKFAEIQTEETKKGWEIIESEFELEGEIEGMKINAKIDRIDRAADGSIRILDYKSLDVPLKPRKAHIGSAREGDIPSYEYVGKNQCWIDLQLPLYQILLSKSGLFENRKISCGYFNMPKALADTKIEIWDELDENMLESAEICAKGIVRDIKLGKFWPPKTKVQYDDFSKLLLDNPMKTVHKLEATRILSDEESLTSGAEV
jgi:ATP-dependent helicase/nuclease subunit B